MPERPAVTTRLPLAPFGLDELVGYPEQHGAARQPEKGNGEERADDAHEDQAQHDRARGAPDLAEDPLVPWQGAHGQRDEDRVVAGEEEVEEPDLEEAEPELRAEVERGHARLAVLRSPGERRPASEGPGAGATTA